MRSQVPERSLRGRDPITIEIEVNTLSTKPLNQLALGNVADLYALAERDDLPAGLRVRLKGFPDRMQRAIRDLPNGGVFADFAEALAEVPAERVPQSLRDAVAADAQTPTRGDAERARAAELAEAWAGTEPEPFDIGAPKQVQQVPAPRRREKRATRTPRASGGSGGGASRTPTRSATPRDTEREDWIRQVILERLSGRSSDGLLQTVLVAGLRHRARERYPDLQPREVLQALKTMEQEGRVRHSAGRWRIKAR